MSVSTAVKQAKGPSALMGVGAVAQIAVDIATKGAPSFQFGIVMVIIGAIWMYFRLHHPQLKPRNSQPAVVWAPEFTSRFFEAYWRPWKNRRPRFFIVWGWFFWVLIFVAFMYFLVIPFYALIGIWLLQGVTLLAQGVKWLGYDWWHKKEING